MYVCIESVSLEFVNGDIRRLRYLMTKYFQITFIANLAKHGQYALDCLVICFLDNHMFYGTRPFRIFDVISEVGLSYAVESDNIAVFDIGR